MFEVRLANLENFARDTTDRLARIETSVDDIKSHGATKADLLETKVKIADAMHTQTWKLIGVIITVCGLLVAAVYWIATHSANNDVIGIKPMTYQVAPTAPAEIPARPPD